MSLARFLRPSGLACLLILLPWAFLGADDPKPTGKVADKPKEKPGDAAKTDKPQGDDTGAKGWNLHIRLDISTDKPQGEDAGSKGDKADAGSKADKTKAEDAGASPTPERYAELLNSTSVVVRKRAAMVLLKKGPDAYPALLELSLRETDPEMRKLLDAKVDGSEVYSTPQKIGALVKVLKDPTTNATRRLAACIALPAMAGVAAAKPHLAEINEALEVALGDGNEDVQLAAARALEFVEDPAGFAKRLTSRTKVSLALDADTLKALRLKPDDVLQAVRKGQPRADAKLTDGDVIQLTVSEDERLAVERLKLPANGDVRLKDVVLKKKLAAGGGEK